VLKESYITSLSTYLLTLFHLSSIPSLHTFDSPKTYSLTFPSAKMTQDIEELRKAVELFGGAVVCAVPMDFQDASYVRLIPSAVVVMY
jgi:hypothetical protein